MKLIIFTSILVFLGGCSIGPQTKQELYKSHGYLEKRCSQKNHVDTYNMLLHNMNWCIAGKKTGTTIVGNSPVTWSSKVTIQGDFNPSESSTVSVYVAGGPGHYFYTTIVDISTSENCKSDLSIYGWSSMNKNDLNLIDRWLSNNDTCID